MAAEESRVDSSHSSPDPGCAALVAGLLVLEFAAASSVYLASVLLPAVVVDLRAESRYPLVVAPQVLGLFLALPLADRVVHRLGPARTLAAALVLTVLGTVGAALAPDPWVYAAGRLTAGFAGGVLAVFGIGAALDRLDDRARTRVFAWLAAMWVAPALVVPPLAILLESAIGWRWTSVGVLPLVLAARVLIGRSAAVRSTDGSNRPSARWVLVPAGTAVLLVANGAWWGLVGIPFALFGAAVLVPDGTLRGRPGQPREFLVFGLLVFAYFGGEGLLTLTARRGLGLSATATGWVFAATGVCWGLASLLQPRLVGPDHERDPVVSWVGAVLLAGGLGWIAGQLAGWSPAGLVPALVASAALGVGMGVAYPTLYFRATRLRPGGPTAVRTAAAILLVESLSSALVAALAGATVAVAVHMGAGERTGQAWVFGGCAVAAVLLLPLLPHRTET